MIKLKAVCLLVVGFGTLAAALVVILTNMGNEWTVHLFFKDLSLRRGVMLGYAGVLGAVLWALWRWSLPAGVRALRAWRKAGAAKATADRLSKLESGGEPKSPTS